MQRFSPAIARRNSRWRLTGAALAVLAPAAVQAQTTAPIHAAAPNGPCSQYELSASFGGSVAPSCYKLQPAASPTPGVSLSPGVLSGAGSSVVNIPDGSNGLVGVASGQALASPAGTFVVPAMQNIVEASTAFSGAAWFSNNSATATNSTTGPTGAVDGARLAARGPYAGVYQPITLTTNVPTVCSVWAKAAGPDADQQVITFMLADVGHGQVSAGFTDTTLNGSPTYEIASLGTTKLRLTGKAEIPFANGWRQLIIYVEQVGAPINQLDLVVGSGDWQTGANSTNTIYVWHANCGPGHHAFDMPNTSATTIVSRTRDRLTVANPWPTSLALVTFNRTYSQRLPPGAMFDLAAADASWVGVYPLNSIVVQKAPPARRSARHGRSARAR
jgi:hypothetical protein